MSAHHLQFIGTTWFCVGGAPRCRQRRLAMTEARTLLRFVVVGPTRVAAPAAMASGATTHSHARPSDRPERCRRDDDTEQDVRAVDALRGARAAGRAGARTCAAIARDCAARREESGDVKRFAS